MVDTDDKLPDYITLKNLVTLITCVIQDGAKFYPKIFLEVALYNKKHLKKEEWRIHGWCLSEEEKKEIEPVFTEKC